MRIFQPFAGSRAPAGATLDLNFRDGFGFLRGIADDTLGSFADNVETLVSIGSAVPRLGLDRDGVFHTIPQARARYAFDPVFGRRRGIQSEGFAQRLSASPTALDNGAWTLNAATIVPNVAMSPVLGGQTADLLLETTASAPHWIAQFLTTTPGTPIVAEAIVKAAGRTRCRLALDGNAAGGPIASMDVDLARGAITALAGKGGLIPLAQGHFLLWVAGNALAGSGQTYPLLYCLNDAGAPSYAGNAALGLQVSYFDARGGYGPSSPILAANGQRAEDVISTGLSGWFRASEGTFFIDCEIDGEATAAGQNTLLALRKDNANYIWLSRVLNTIRMDVAIGGTTKTFAIQGGGAPGSFRVGMRYVAGNFGLIAQGGDLFMTTTFDALPTGLTTLDIGWFNQVAVPLNGVVGRVTYWPYFRDDDDMRAIVG